jgi:hypothetical protein
MSRHTGRPTTGIPSEQPRLQLSWILAPDLIATAVFTRQPSVADIGVLKQYLDLAAQVLTDAKP